MKIYHYHHGCCICSFIVISNIVLLSVSVMHGLANVQPFIKNCNKNNNDHQKQLVSHLGRAHSLPWIAYTATILTASLYNFCFFFCNTRFILPVQLDYSFPVHIHLPANGACWMHAVYIYFEMIYVALERTQHRFTNCFFVFFFIFFHLFVHSFTFSIRSLFAKIFETSYRLTSMCVVVPGVTFSTCYRHSFLNACNTTHFVSVC